MRKPIGTCITQIVSVDPGAFRVRLRFSDGVVGEIDLGHIFREPRGLAAEVLKGGIFERCFVESGALAWPNGLDLCPDALHRWLDEQGEHRAA